MTPYIPIPISCEFFPTTTPQGAEKLAVVREALSVLNCEYYSVTYGAGGSTRDRTFSLVERIQQENNQPAMPHLTCVAAKKADLRALLDEYQQIGINRLMALRGDMPSGMYQAGDLNDARELVAFVRQLWGAEAQILVAAYPETHPRSKTPAMDLQHFKEKIDAGADEAVTQYFFNVDAYLRFRDEAAKIGVQAPIVPGIMPITNYLQLARFSDACGAEIPRWIRKRLEALQDDMDGLKAFGADVVATMCQRLIDEQAPSLHFYSMNRSDSMLAIARRLNWIE